MSSAEPGKFASEEMLQFARAEYFLKLMSFTEEIVNGARFDERDMRRFMALWIGYQAIRMEATPQAADAAAAGPVERIAAAAKVMEAARAEFFSDGARARLRKILDDLGDFLSERP